MLPGKWKQTFLTGRISDGTIYLDNVHSFRLPWQAVPHLSQNIASFSPLIFDQPSKHTPCRQIQLRGWTPLQEPSFQEPFIWLCLDAAFHQCSFTNRNRADLHQNRDIFFSLMGICSVIWIQIEKIWRWDFMFQRKLSLYAKQSDFTSFTSLFRWSGWNVF